MKFWSLLNISRNCTLIVLVFCLENINAQESVFNTLARKDVSGQVSSLSAAEKEEVKDSIEIVLKEKKIEYNMGFLPLDSVVITSAYGPRKHPITNKWSTHTGVDIRGRNKNVTAVQTGIIIDKGYDSLLGQYVKLSCGSFVFIYGHLKHIYVKVGESVTGGQVIGKTGGTGRVTADHLHFSIKKSGEYIDPLPILKLIFEHS